VILNEAAVKMLNRTATEIIGESVVMHDDPLEVMGVVEDFYYESAARTVEPLIFTAYSDNIRNISVRFVPGSDPGQILQIINESIQSFDPSYVMLQSYPTDIIRDYYLGEERLQKILLSGSLLSILIVLLGIFASSILIVLLFQTLITLGRTRKTARRNPVEALRYE